MVLVLQKALIHGGRKMEVTSLLMASFLPRLHTGTTMTIRPLEKYTILMVERSSVWFEYVLQFSFQDAHVNTPALRLL